MNITLPILPHPRTFRHLHLIASQVSHRFVSTHLRQQSSFNFHSLSSRVIQTLISNFTLKFQSKLNQIYFKLPSFPLMSAPIPWLKLFSSSYPTLTKYQCFQRVKISLHEVPDTHIIYRVRPFLITGLPMFKVFRVGNWSFARFLSPWLPSLLFSS